MRMLTRVAAVIFACVFAPQVMAQLACPSGTVPAYISQPNGLGYNSYCVRPDGRPHGPSKGWELPSGAPPRLKYAGSFVDGLRDGSWKEYSQGKLSTEGRYAAGHKEGLWTGNRVPYVRGLSEGRETYMLGDVLHEREWSSGKVIRESQMRGGRPLLLLELPIDGVGRASGTHRRTEYTSAGKAVVTAECIFSEGHLEGPCNLWWLATGNKKLEAVFRDGTIWGSAVWYGVDGNEIYRAGLLDGTGSFRPPASSQRGPFEELSEAIPTAHLSDGAGYAGNMTGRTRQTGDAPWLPGLDYRRESDDIFLIAGGSLKSGYRQGVWQSFQATAADSSGCEASFDNGLLDGQLRCWTGGKLRREETYRRGKLNGFVRLWYSNSKLSFEAEFLDDKLSGIIRKWAYDGALTAEGEVVDGQLLLLVKNPNNQPGSAEIDIVDGRPMHVVISDERGVQSYRLEDGKLRGAAVRRDEAGRLASITDTQSSGIKWQRIYYPNGEQFTFDLGAKNSTQYWTTSDGRMRETIKFENGGPFLYSVAGPKEPPTPRSAPMPSTNGHGTPTTQSVTAPQSKVFAADAMTGERTNTVLYYVDGQKVYAADAFTGARTDRVLRHIVGDRVYAADSLSGAQTTTVLRYIIGDRVYAADALTGNRTEKVLSYIEGGRVYAADAFTGARTNTVLRHVVGNAKTD